MKCKAGKNLGNKLYKCSQCGKTQQLETSDEVLQICSCGNDVFHSTPRFEKSSDDYEKRIHDTIRHIAENFCPHKYD